MRKICRAALLLLALPAMAQQPEPFDIEGECQTWFDGYYSRSDTGERE